MMKMPGASKFASGAAVLMIMVSLVPGGALGADQKAAFAPTPPMGWNSWDSFGTTVREDEVKANADVMARDLLPFGWNYIVVDIEWYAPEAQGHVYKEGAELKMDANGRLLPAENKFPSAASGNGFKPLAAYLHSKGLKFGIHIMRGIPRQAVEQNTPIANSSHRAGEIADRTHLCPWNPDMYGVDMSKPGAQDYYDSLASLYASWGVDFIKADDMSRPYLQRAPEVAALSRAIAKSGRKMLLSLSPGPAPVSEAASLERYAQLWRISDDFWDTWRLLKAQFDYVREWSPYIGKNGTWPDADMLPLGKLRVTDKDAGPQDSKFTPDEQQTVMTLWSIVRSPLFFGGDLRALDSSTKALITNPEVLAVNQSSSGNRQPLEHEGLRFWTANAPGGAGNYAAVFNIGDKPIEATADWPDLGIATSSALVRDLWSRQDLGSAAQLRVTLRPHAGVLYKVTVSKQTGESHATVH
jgi:alpha-galactosidase